SRVSPAPPTRRSPFDEARRLRVHSAHGSETHFGKRDRLRLAGPRREDECRVTRDRRGSGIGGDLVSVWRSGAPSAVRARSWRRHRTSSPPRAGTPSRTWPKRPRTPPRALGDPQALCPGRRTPLRRHRGESSPTRPARRPRATTRRHVGRLSSEAFRCRYLRRPDAAAVPRPRLVTTVLPPRPPSRRDAVISSAA